MNFQIPKGLFDILPYGVDQEWKLSHLWQFVEAIARKSASTYGYKEIRTPIFERTDVFTRSAGESSDIILKKEMYTFVDKASRSMSLRPEGTAGVLRALVESNIFNISMPYKFYYIGPMFRYDRPQAGRYRQHHQFGIETFGLTDPLQDGEVIDLLWHFYRQLGLKDLTLYLNSVGDLESREAYKKELKKYLAPFLSNLSADSQERFKTNPLRILDSKEDQDKEILAKAPLILDFLNTQSQNHFDTLCALLKKMQIPFTINPQLVRGLDYYNHTVFEVVCGKLGAQNSIGGGGRYDGLVKTFGGQDLSAIGFGTGMERIIQTMLAQQVEVKDPTNPFIYFIPLDEESKKSSLYLVSALRHAGISVEMAFIIKKLQKALQLANNLKVSYCAIVGEEERKAKKIVLKDMAKREQIEIPWDTSLEYFQKLWLQQCTKE